VTSLVPDGLEATVVLLRHGESTAIVDGRFQGQLDTPLSPTGLRQAELAAARLAKPHAAPALPVPLGAPVEIAHSPLTRTSQTATAVADAANGNDAFSTRIPLRPDAGFLEIGQGDWEGRPLAEITERWGDILDEWRVRPTAAHAPGGESLDDVVVRARPAIASLLERLAVAGPGTKPSSSPVLPSHHEPPSHPWSVVVAHDGIFKVVLLTLFDLPLERFWLFPFALCGITVVEIAAGRPRLRAHNLTEHLAPLLEEQARAISEQRERTGAL
jgi:phosphoserine phosphatase